MNTPFFFRLHPLLQLLTLVLTTLVSFFVFALLGFAAVTLFWDISLLELIGSMGTSGIDDVGMLKVMQIFQSIGIFIVPAILIARLASPAGFSFLGFSKTAQPAAFAWMLLILIAAQPVVVYTGVLNQAIRLPEFLSGIESWMSDMEERAMSLTESFLHVTTLGGLLVNLLMISVIPGLGEELFFRGLLQKLFHAWLKNIHVAVVLSALLFSALHMQFYGFIPRFFLGLLFGYLFVWSGNIWYPVLAHLLHNAIPVTVYYLHARGTIQTAFDEVGTGSVAWIYALSGFVFMVIFSVRFRQLFVYPNTHN